MKVYKFFPPYQRNGRTTFPNTQNKSGVYIIKEAGKIVYVGSSQKNLYKTMYRHFEKWHHRSQPVITYVNNMQNGNYTIRVILCTGPQASKLERALIIRHQPRDNEQKFESYKLTFPDHSIIAKYQDQEVITECPF